MCSGKNPRPVGGEVRVQPVRLALEPGRRHVGIVIGLDRTGEQRCEVQVMAVDVELRHGRHHRVDLILFTGESRDQLGIMESGSGRRQTDLHERHRVWC